MKTTFITRITKKLTFIGFCLLVIVPMSLTSCEDFFEQESESIIYSEDDHLTNWSDSVSSMVGILNKLQAVADRTILLGEVRGDLVTVTSDASADLQQLAIFDVNDDNIYNQPRDYYAVINNCNYYIKNVKAQLKNNRNDYVFMKEYAAVKAIRAWTYLQLALNYGSVPFVTEPILTKDEAEVEYPRYELEDICAYFLNDLAELPADYDREYPGLTHSKFPVSDARLVFFPLNILRGELNLWMGNYREAALCYYKYLNDRYGTNTAYATGTDFSMWQAGSTMWVSPVVWRSSSNLNFYADETYGSSGAPSELITMIPCNTLRANGNYSELNNLFNSTTENNHKYSITPSERMKEISAAQVNCCLNSNGSSVLTPPLGLNKHMDGDLRLSYVWQEDEDNDVLTGERVETQFIKKYPSSSYNVHIYRRQMVYLRMAEALNLAGYPHVAFDILSSGVNNDVIMIERLMHYDNPTDSAYLAQFDFPTYRYELVTRNDILNMSTTHNTIGIHTRGSGWTPMNESYQLPNDTIEPDEAKRRQLIAEQQVYVDSLIINESALEFAFEGTRYYDIMRYAMRQANPGETMAKFIYARRGEKNSAATEAEIKATLRDKRNWYLRWNGKVGY